MLTFLDLKTLVRNGEGLHLEFKLKASHPDKIMKEVIAFSNSEGGTLLIGVSDNGDIEGLKYPEEDEYVLKKAIRQYCRPIINYTFYKVEVENNRSVLVFEFKPHTRKPAYFITDFSTYKGIAYVRVADKCIQASHEMIYILAHQEDKSVRFTFGKTEKKLFELLDLKGKIQIDDFIEFAKINRSLASRTLVRLTLANVLNIFPGENTDFYTLKSN